MTTRLFDEDPELLAYVPEHERELARRSAVVGVQYAELGPWDPAGLGTPAWGLLVLRGLIARDVGVAGVRAAELLGAGDVVRVDDPPARDEIVTVTATWTVLEPARIGVLDDRVNHIARRWPTVGAALLERCERRATRLAVAQAISHLTRVDTRVLVLLWSLADRWGRVASDGIVLPLRLTHRTLARLVGARRPSVTSAIGTLARRGVLDRRPDGSWLLQGPPPVELTRPAEALSILAAAPTRRPPARLPAEADPRQLSRDMGRLSAAYRLQAERAASAARNASAARERARGLVAEAEARRLRLRAPAGAPPSA
jgi:hypothetical protein